MTPGPASRIVTVLPRKRPTPMAPPMASMVSCLCVSLRRSSSYWGATTAESPLGDSVAGAGSGSEFSAMLVQIEQGVAEPVNFSRRIVMNQRDSHDAGFYWHTKPLHKTRGVHVAIANANSGSSHGLCHRSGRGFWQSEAECRHALVEQVFAR